MSERSLEAVRRPQRRAPTRVPTRTPSPAPAPSSGWSRLPEPVLTETGRPGASLDLASRARFEARLGHRLDAVRIHSDAPASRSVGWVGSADRGAYTLGTHVVAGAAALRGSAGEALLAHELTHVVQHLRTPGVAGRSGSAGMPVGDAVSRPSDPAEAEARAVAAATRAGGAGGGGVGGARAASGVGARPRAVVHRDGPSTPDLGGVTLTLRNDGQLEAVVGSPKLPAVGSVAAGIRRAPGGRYEFVFGGGSTLLTPAEVPKVLRGMTDAGTPGQRALVPMVDCKKVLGQDGRPKPYLDYRAASLITPGAEPVSEAFYRVVTAGCQATPKEAPPKEPSEPFSLPPPPPREYQDAPQVLPEGQAYA